MNTLPQNDPVGLAELLEGERATLANLDVSDVLAEHLMCLGFVPGVEVVVGKSGPGGDPRVFHVDGTDVALRRETSQRLTVVRLTSIKTTA